MHAANNAGREDIDVTAAAAARKKQRAREAALASLAAAWWNDPRLEERRIALRGLLPPPREVVVALDATRDGDDREDEIRRALRNLVCWGHILRPRSDSLAVIAVFRTRGHTACFTGTTSVENQVVQKAKKYRQILHSVVEELRQVEIPVTLRVVASSSPKRDVIAQQVNSSKAAWVVLDRLFQRDLKRLEKLISCKVAVFNDYSSVKASKAVKTIPQSKGKAMNMLTATVSFELERAISKFQHAWAEGGSKLARQYCNNAHEANGFL